MTSFANLPALSRLVITGRDRARYLHNFCSNEIKSLPVGRVAEAFFCDVKARIIAHGYVLALEDRHECWMLGGDEAALIKHLNKYIILEDVQVISAANTTTSRVAIGNDAIQALLKLPPLDSLSALNFAATEPLNCVDVAVPQDADGNKNFVAMSVTWADTPMLWIAGTLAVETTGDTDQAAFDRLRIRERFPIIHQDMSIDHMAPEAERNSSAISYAKGCYLGQEPIARLDAMGHVNRSLRCVKTEATPNQFLNAAILTPEGTNAGIVTSTVASDAGAIGLAIVRTNASQGPLHMMIDGAEVAVSIEC